LLVLPDEALYQQTRAKKIDILVAMKEKIGDQKIDFLIAKVTDKDSDPFVALIYDDSLLLHHWP